MFSHQDKILLERLLLSGFQQSQVDHVLNLIQGHDTSGNSTLLNIPEDVQITILLYLEINDIRKVAEVNSHFFKLLSQDKFWKQFFMIHFDFTLDFILSSKWLEDICFRSEFISQHQTHSLQLRILGNFKLVSSLVTILLKSVITNPIEHTKYRQLSFYSLGMDERQFKTHCSQLNVPECDPYIVYMIDQPSISYYKNKIQPFLINSFGIDLKDTFKNMVKSQVQLSILLYTPIPRLSKVRIQNPKKIDTWSPFSHQLTRLETKESSHYTINKKHITLYDLLIGCMSVKNFKDDAYEEKLLGLSEPVIDETGTQCIQLVFRD